MNAANAVRLMEMLTYYQPNTPKPDNPEVASDVWAYELRDFEFEDARDAIRKLCMDARRQGVPWLVELRDIVTEVCAQRSKRLAERRHLVQPPSGLDAVEYRAWLVDTDRAIQRRDWTPPPAIEGTRSGESVVTSLLAKLPQAN